jgi:hypothetical protein
MLENIRLAYNAAASGSRDIADSHASFSGRSAR